MDADSYPFLFAFFLLFIRVVAFVFSAGDLTAQLPIRLKIGIALVISTTLAAPLQLQVETVAETIPMLVVQEAICGSCLGLAVSLLIAGFGMAGSLIGQMVGGNFSFANATNPQGHSTFEQFFRVVAIAVLFSIGGDRQVIDAALTSVAQQPPGEIWAIQNAFEFLLNLLAQSFEFGLRVSLPIVVSLLVGTVLTGILAKFVPYFGFWGIGLSLNAVIVVIGLLASMLAAVAFFEKEVIAVIAKVAQFNTWVGN